MRRGETQRGKACTDSGGWGDPQDSRCGHRATRPQAKGRQPPLYIGRGKRGPSPRGFRRNVALLTPRCQTSGLKNHEEINFYCLSPPGTPRHHISPVPTPCQVTQPQVRQTTGEGQGDLQGCTWLGPQRASLRPDMRT